MEFFNIDLDNSIAAVKITVTKQNMETGLSRRQAFKLAKQNDGVLRRNGWRNWTVYY